jgi:acyl-CoA thioester hydrolase
VTIEAPFARYEGEVLPAWIDANGHLNLAYYIVLFDYATDLLFETIDIGLNYKKRENKGTFVAETHILYERELLVGERVRVESRILGADLKRLHLAHEMFAVTDGRRAAMQELMFLAIDFVHRRVAPWPADAGERVRAAAAAHAALPRPDWVGRRVQMPTGMTRSV